VSIVVRPAAVADIQDDGKCYEEEVPGLGEDLVSELDQLFARLAAFPRSAPLVAGYEPIRRSAPSAVSVRRASIHGDRRL